MVTRTTNRFRGAWQAQRGFYSQRRLNFLTQTLNKWPLDRYQAALNQANIHTLDFFYKRINDPKYEDGLMVKEREVMLGIRSHRRLVMWSSLFGVMILMVMIIAFMIFDTKASRNTTSQLINKQLAPKTSQLTNHQVDDSLEKMSVQERAALILYGAPKDWADIMFIGHTNVATLLSGRNGNSTTNWSWKGFSLRVNAKGEYAFDVYHLVTNATGLGGTSGKTAYFTRAGDSVTYKNHVLTNNGETDETLVTQSMRDLYRQYFGNKDFEKVVGKIYVVSDTEDSLPIISHSEAKATSSEVEHHSSSTSQKDTTVSSGSLLNDSGISDNFNDDSQDGELDESKLSDGYYIANMHAKTKEEEAQTVGKAWGGFGYQIDIHGRSIRAYGSAGAGIYNRILMIDDIKAKTITVLNQNENNTNTPATRQVSVTMKLVYRDDDGNKVIGYIFTNNNKGTSLAFSESKTGLNYVEYTLVQKNKTVS